MQQLGNPQVRHRPAKDHDSLMQLAVVVSMLIN